ncbi:MAG: DNA mismatch repair protein MutS, partial [Polyangiaceae bacterium]|nr:DNA mismatch repair protein MutS [Polyangiaceae bacterium]
MDDPRCWYDGRLRALGDELGAIGARYDQFAWCRLVVLLFAIAFAVATPWRGLGTPGWAACAAAALLFVVLRTMHRRLAGRRDTVLLKKQYAERGLSRLNGKWSAFEQHGARYLQPDHPYALDLDIFGSGALFQLLNDTRTAMGQSCLATWLASPANVSTIAARQRAIVELAALHHLREDLAVAGTRTTDDNPDPEPLLVWASREPSLRASTALRVVAWLSPALLIALLSLASHPLVPSWAFLVPFIINSLLLVKLGPTLRAIIDATSARADELEKFGRMLALIEKGSFESPAMLALQASVRASGRTASREIAALARIVSILDARLNGAFRAVIAPALMWDVHCAIALEKWQNRVGLAARGWLQALAEFEALSSLATFAFEHPDYALPSISDDRDALHFTAEGLGHPLIDAQRRVVNDVALPGPGSVLLVTGSNMSGKSTLLRSIGVAAVLALAGAPVCARRLSMSRCVVRSSLRVSDSLRDGISRFYAELLKIKGVTDSATSGEPVLFLLDEILHGTNSRERHIGARSIIRNLIAQGTIGAVSTHDLALTALAEE